jgi:hypothetical protein
MDWVEDGTGILSSFIRRAGVLMMFLQIRCGVLYDIYSGRSGLLVWFGWEGGN